MPRRGSSDCCALPGNRPPCYNLSCYTMPTAVLYVCVNTGMCMSGVHHACYPRCKALRFGHASCMIPVLDWLCASFDRRLPSHSVGDILAWTALLHRRLQWQQPSRRDDVGSACIRGADPVQASFQPQSALWQLQAVRIYRATGRCGADCTTASQKAHQHRPISAWRCGIMQRAACAHMRK